MNIVFNFGIGKCGFKILSKCSVKCLGVSEDGISLPLLNMGEGIVSLFMSFAIFTAIQSNFVFRGISALQTEAFFLLL